MTDDVLRDPTALVLRCGGYLRQTADSASRGAPAPYARVCANDMHVAFQIPGRFNAWLQALTIDDPTRDSQGRLSVVFAWCDVSAVHLAKRSAVVYAGSGAAFAFAPRRRKNFRRFADFVRTVDVTVVPVRRTWTDFYRTTRRRTGAQPPRWCRDGKYGRGDRI